MPDEGVPVFSFLMWYLKYDETRAMVKIERVRDGEDAPYMSWYLEGKPWFE